MKKDNVKVVMDKNDQAMYFSRSPIPYQNEESFNGEKSFKHQGLYGYTKKALENIQNMPKTFLDASEGLEQLRMLYYGMKIFIYKTIHDSIGVDQPEDILLVERILQLQSQT